MNWLKLFPNSMSCRDMLATDGTQRAMSLRNPGTSERVVAVGPVRSKELVVPGVGLRAPPGGRALTAQGRPADGAAGLGIRVRPVGRGRRPHLARWSGRADCGRPGPGCGGRAGAERGVGAGRRGPWALRAAGGCPIGHVCVWDGPNWTGRVQILRADVVGVDRLHPGPWTATAFDVRSLYVALDSATAEVFRQRGVPLRPALPPRVRHLAAVRGITDIRTGSPMRRTRAGPFARLRTAGRLWRRSPAGHPTR